MTGMCRDPEPPFDHSCVKAGLTSHHSSCSWNILTKLVLKMTFSQGSKVGVSVSVCVFETLQIHKLSAYCSRCSPLEPVQQQQLMDQAGGWGWWWGGYLGIIMLPQCFLFIIVPCHPAENKHTKAWKCVCVCSFFFCEETTADAFSSY